MRVNKVSFQLMLMRKTKQMMAIKIPPINWRNPVPTRLRTPSTSVITRLTSFPVCWLSKKRVGNRSKCFCTLARSTEIKCWASTLSNMVSA